MGSSQERVHISTIRDRSKDAESDLCKRRCQLHRLRHHSATSAGYGRGKVVGSDGQDDTCLFSSPEHGPLVPWRFSHIAEPRA